MPSVFQNAHSVLKIVSKSQSVLALPIDVNAVKGAVVQLCGGDADIQFFHVDMNDDLVRGYFKKGHVPTGRPYSGESKLMGNIYVSLNQDEVWRNFVGVKEMLHMLDSETGAIGSKDDVVNLIQDLHAELDIAALDLTNGRHSKLLADHAAIVGAIEVLFPYEARCVIREKYKAGAIADYELSQIAMIPERYVRISMRDSWFTHCEASRKKANLTALA